nr:hypothetical protein [Tanacetum cinerariifolium]
MSADSAVTYSSVYSEPRSWSIPSEDPYEEAAQQLFEQAPHSPVYVPRDHVPVFVPEFEHPEDLVPAEGEAPTSLLPPGFLSPCIRPLSPRALRAEMNAIASSLYRSIHPSGTPPLLPISTPSTSRIAGILEANTPPRNMPLLATPRPGCEVGESPAAAARRQGPAMAHGVDCSYIETRLQDTKRRMMAALELVNRKKDRAAVRAEIEVLKNERLAYEQEGIRTREAFARSEAHCRALEARVAVLETHALTPPYTPQHNGVSKRRNQTLLDMVGSMMNLTTMPISFWGYALETAARILNMVPIKKVDRTPYEIWHEKAPNKEHNEVAPIEVAPQNVIVPICRSVRIPQVPDRYGYYVDIEEYELRDLDEPLNYKTALADPESNKWLEAMDTEMQSMKDNQVWYLVDLPSNVTPPYTPQHNGVSKRRNQTLLDMVGSMMNLTTMPISFWGYALETAARILNMVPIKKVDRTPYEIWHEKAPKKEHNEVAPIEVAPQNVIVPIRRSARIPQVPDRYGYYVDIEEYELGDLDEPPNYKTALADPESNKWLEAMDTEMQSMKVNQVWYLVDLPSNGRTVGSKWLFKKKTDMDGNVHTFKARLVAKSFTQTYRADYEETFSSVTDIRAIRILLAIDVFYDYEI